MTTLLSAPALQQLPLGMRMVEEGEGTRESCCPTHTPAAMCPPMHTLTIGAAGLDAKHGASENTPKSRVLRGYSSSSALASPGTAEALAAVEVRPEQNRLAAVNSFNIDPTQPKRSLGELVEALQAELDGGKKDLERLYNIMMSFDFDSGEWKRYEFWDDSKKYTRNLIASVPGSFCLMLLCWNAEKGSPIHNHAGSECFMRVLQGAIVEKQFVVKNGEGDASASCNWNKMTCSNIPPSDLLKTHENVYSTGGCTFINDSLGVHQVENPYAEKAVTLHAYIPGYETCKSWAPDAANPENVKIQQCSISFDTEGGSSQMRS